MTMAALVAKAFCLSWAALVALRLDGGTDLSWWWLALPLAVGAALYLFDLALFLLLAWDWHDGPAP